MTTENNQTTTSTTTQSQSSSAATEANTQTANASTTEQNTTTTASGETQKKDSQLLFEENKTEVKTEEQKTEKPTAADMKKFLEEKLGDKKGELEGKSDEDIAKMFDEAKAKETADAEAAKAFSFEKIKIPDTMPVTDELKGKVTAIAGKHKLGNEAMQELIDTHVEIMNAQTAQWDTMKKGWREEVEKDPVLGGKNLDTVKKSANDVVRKFAGNENELKEFQEDLILLGLGNKKSFIRFLNNIAAKTKEDTQDGSSSGAQPKKKTTAQIMYPGMKSEADQ